MKNAQYQLTNIMPLARARGCQCQYTEKDFKDFADGKWQQQ